MSDICRWVKDDSFYYETSCINYFDFNEGGIKENNFKFCPYCGKAIIESEVKEDED